VPDVAALSDRSVQRALQKDLKMPSRVAALKPLLTLKMKKKRLAFCRKYEVSCRTNRTALISGGRFECEVA
jgi:hypothetical protein